MIMQYYYTQYNFFIRPPVLHSRGPLEIMKEKNHQQGVSRLVTSNFHLKIAERIGDTDGSKALDRNGKELKKEKCLSWVVSVSRDSMAQCRSEVRTDLVNMTERLKGDEKEMMIA